MQHRREVEVDYYVVVCIIIYIANQQRILPKLVGYNGSLFYEEFIKTIGHWRILKCEAIGQPLINAVIGNQISALSNPTAVPY